MDQQKSSLCVSLHNVEFVKPQHYFITVQMGQDGERHRTDISANVSNPVFTMGVIVIPLSNFKIDINDILIFQSYVVTDREDGQIPELNNQGQTRLLGECTLALGPLTSALTDISGMGIRQHLKFTRNIGNEQKTVGRFIVNLKLVGEQVIPLSDEKPIEQDEIFHQLPASDPFMNFNWRLRVDLRSGIDLPLNRNEQNGGLPTSFVELGWTMYENQPPDDYQVYLTKLVEGNRHPIWNQQFLIPNPQAIQTKEGFLYVALKDRHITEPIQMRPFTPMNMMVHCQNAEYAARPKLLMSVTLEMPNKESFVDELVDIIVKMIHYDPLPYSTRVFLVMSQNMQSIESIPFQTFDMNGPTNFAQFLQDYASSPVFISPVMKIPPHKVESVYNAVAVFTLPKTYLDKGIAFHIASRDDSIPAEHSLPNAIVGQSETIDETLKKLYQQLILYQ